MNYYEIQAINATALKEANRSLAHFNLLYNLGETKQASPAMKLGTLTHCMVLEPEEVHRRYAIAPDIDKRTKAGKAEWENFSKANADKDIVSAEDFCRAEAATAAVMDHRSSELFAGDKEVTRQWTELDLPMKALMDCEDSFADRVVDLKTCQDASPEAFMRSAWNFGYHIQAAHYSAAYEAHHGTWPAFYFVAVETVPPFNVAAYRVSERLMAKGMARRFDLLNQIKACMESGDWPGYGSETFELEAPAWA